jgi:hypothetical protein
VTDQSQIALFYMDTGNSLSHLHFTNTTWQSPVLSTDIGSKSESSLTNIDNFVAVPSYISPVSYCLYYFTKNRVIEAEIILDTGVSQLFGLPSAPSLLPNGVDIPPLIAAVSRPNATVKQPRRRLFYVWRLSSSKGSVLYEQESLILNMTFVAPAVYPMPQNSWPAEEA